MVISKMPSQTVDGIKSVFKLKGNAAAPPTTGHASRGYVGDEDKRSRNQVLDHVSREIC
jgi:hypothetical protein